MSYYEKVSKKRRRRSYKIDRSKTLYKYNVFNIFVIVLVFIAGLIYFIAFPKSERSEYEKRKLEEFPKYKFGSIFDGSFTNQLSKHIDDAVPFRDKTKDVAAKIMYYFGLHAGGDDTIVIPNDNDNSQAEETLPPLQTRPPEQSSADTTAPQTQTTPATTKKPFVEEGIAENGLYIQKETVRVMEIPGGTKAAMERYAQVLNQYRQYLGDDINIYSLVAPTAFQFYTPDDVLDKYGNQKDKMEYIKSKLDRSIKFIDVIPALEPHTSEYIYARTDFHWMPLGAYYAAEEFAKVADVPFTDISKYTPKKIEDFVGAFLTYVPASYKAVLTENPDTYTYYEAPNMALTTTEFYTQSFVLDHVGDFLVPAKGANAYSTSLGGDEWVVKIKTNVKNGRKLLMIKDSYGNSIAPFLSSSFEEIYVVDYRYFELNIIDFIKQQEITDLMFGTGLWGAITTSKIDAINALTLK